MPVLCPCDTRKRSKGDPELERRFNLNNMFHITTRVYNDALLVQTGVDVERPENPEAGYYDPEARHNEDGSEDCSLAPIASMVLLPLHL